MNIYSNTPYTYRIYWSKTGMNYYGVRYAANCHPTDLWSTYFTSSWYVQEHINIHGDPDLIEIRKVFTGDRRVENARLWETTVLKRINAVTRADYLNKTDNISVGLHDTAVKEKQRLAMIRSLSPPAKPHPI